VPVPAPLELHRDKIRPEWVDYNGHMNLAYYVLVFDHATDAFLDYIGLTEAFRKNRNCSTFAAEIHVNYLSEVKEPDEVYITTRLIGFDQKRIHFFHSMYHAGEDYLAATSEMLSLYMDMSVRRVGLMPTEIMDRLTEIQQSHGSLSVPEQLGSVMKTK